MKFKISPTQLALAIDHMSAVSANGQTIDIIADDPNTITFSSLGPEGHVKFQTTVAIVTEPGQVVLEGKTALSLLRQIPITVPSIVPDIIFEADEHKLSVRAPGFRAKLPAINREPMEWPDLNLTRVGDVSGEVLAAAIKAVQPFADPNTIAVVHGLHIVISPGFMVLEACDGRRAAQVTIPIVGGSDLDIVAGSVGLKAVTALFGQSPSVEIHIPDNRNWLEFSDGETRYIAQVMSGIYPDIQGIYPITIDVAVDVDRKALQAVLSSIESLAGPNEISIVQFRPDTTMLTVGSPDSGHAAISVDLPASITGHASVAAKLDARLAAQAVRSILTDQVQVGIQADSQKPVAFRVPSSSDAIWVVLPLL